MKPEKLQTMLIRWLTMLLRDDDGCAVIRAMVEQHEMPVIDLAHGKHSAEKMAVCQQADYHKSN